MLRIDEWTGCKNCKQKKTTILIKKILFSLVIEKCGAKRATQLCGRFILICKKCIQGLEILLENIASLDYNNFVAFLLEIRYMFKTLALGIKGSRRSFIAYALYMIF